MSSDYVLSARIKHSSKQLITSYRTAEHNLQQSNCQTQCLDKSLVPCLDQTGQFSNTGPILDYGSYEMNGLRGNVLT